MVFGATVEPNNFTSCNHHPPYDPQKNADPDVKPGPKSWVSGTKARFLRDQNAAWYASTTRGPEAAGVFYSQVTKLFIKKYGWDFGHEKDLPEDTPDPTLESLQEPEEAVGDEEAAKRAEHFKSMRSVSNF